MPIYERYEAVLEDTMTKKLEKGEKVKEEKSKKDPDEFYPTFKP